MKTALMVIDVQPVWMKAYDFWTIDGDDLVSKCEALIEKARAADAPVIYVEHVDEDDMEENTPAEDIATDAAIAPLPGDPVVSKRFGSGFLKTDLDRVLKEQGIGRFVACGLSAYGCVEATVLYGKVYGYDVVVAGDAVAGNNSEAFPTTEGIPIFLDAWKRGGIEILNSDDDPFATSS